MEKRFLIEDMSCNHCMMKIEKKLKDIKGIKFDINITNKTLNVKSKKEIDSSSIINAVSDAGYTAQEIVGE